MIHDQSHIFISGIGGAGMAPLALVAHKAGFEVSGSDKQDSDYIEYLKKRGITDITIGQSAEVLAKVHAKKPIDWLVYSSALPKENPNHPELKFAMANNIKHTKRDEFYTHFIKEKNLKLIAVAGTHGKTTTTAMLIWLFKQLGVAVSYAVGAKLSFGDMGEYANGSEYFVYECDEYDRNFLAFHPRLSLITGIDWDHPDIYPTREEYYAAFNQFLSQSRLTYMWEPDAKKLGAVNSTSLGVIEFSDYEYTMKLKGLVNRQDGALAAQGLMTLLKKDEINELTDIMNTFPGLSRRFEQLVPNLYTDYAHTPEKIRGALQMAEEQAGNKIVVVYEGLHNTRQHFIKDQLAHLFDGVKHFYVVPSYLAREDPSLKQLNQQDLVNLLSKPELAEPAELNDELKQAIQEHLSYGDLVLCLSAGSGGSLDEWLRKNF